MRRSSDGCRASCEVELHTSTLGRTSVHHPQTERIWERLWRRHGKHRSPKAAGRQQSGAEGIVRAGACRGNRMRSNFNVAFCNIPVTNITDPAATKPYHYFNLIKAHVVASANWASTELTTSLSTGKYRLCKHCRRVSFQTRSIGFRSGL